MKLIGRKIEMMLDMGKITGYVIAESPSLMSIKDEKTSEIINIPFHKWGIFKVLDAPVLNIYIFMCKNESINCKGVKCLSSKKTQTIKDVSCKAKKLDCGDYNCDFGFVGNIFELPLEIQGAFLDGMKTDIPIQVNKDKKGVENG